MSNQTLAIQICPSPAGMRKQQLRRRYEMFNTILEALVTVGIGVCFLICTILFLCIA